MNAQPQTGRHRQRHGGSAVPRAARRGAPTRFEITVLGEEPRAAYDRVQLTSFFSGKTRGRSVRRAGGLHARSTASTLRLSERAIADRSRRSSACAQPRARELAVRHAGPRDRLVSVRAAGAGARRAGLLTSTARSKISKRSARPRSGAKIGVVIGGGLLGLEAAKALCDLGLETHVVEFAPRLMAVQVDDGGGALLRSKIEALGVRVHTGANTKAIGAGRERAAPSRVRGRHARSKRTSSCSPRASARATSWRAPRGLDGRRARRHRRRRRVPHLRPEHLRDRRMRAVERPDLRPRGAGLSDGAGRRAASSRAGATPRSAAPT